MPYRFLYPSALFFIAVGVYSTRNNLFDVAIVAAFGVVGAILLALEFPLSPIVLGFVLGPHAGGEVPPARRCCRAATWAVFVTRPVAAAFVTVLGVVVFHYGLHLLLPLFTW